MLKAMLKTIPPFPYEIHTPSEMFWVSLQPHLLSRGYRLRPRYDPEWIPSWTKIPGGRPGQFEDSLVNNAALIDAVDISDGKKVVLKRIDTSTNELPLAMKLSSPDLRSDPRNHAVPILDVILIPGNDEIALLVMPFLMDFHDLPFRRVGEVIEMVEQFLDCLEFLHDHNITHMDFCWFNLMMDAGPMVPRGWHFCRLCNHEGRSSGDFEWIERWAVCPVKYYLVDFELSRELDPSVNHRFVGDWGQDRTVPEMSETVSADTFKVDVYQLGNVIKKLTDQYTGLKILESLANKMTNHDPLKRLTACQATKMFQHLKLTWTTRTLEKRVWQRTTPFIDRFMVKYRGLSTVI
ncbi:hypothetical protein M413DRAFT_196962 [Hebeloma cylindrosporum]|uniref:Protein kinase domain-containing protein n=1 Tax=Hebeloma cylindrosporum TaxID=76867 RepID=A0A0C3C6T3_HEBCY|nr:hypothetical protein M413DRAFT_196962 [Hebeloma cylindrosporum h7]